jgi:hypothetical protein
MFTGLSHDAYLHQVGVVHGLETAIGLIERIDAHAMSVHEHTSPARKPDPSSLPFWGSEYFPARR